MSPPAPSSRSPKILVIRRDNIGDLVCTTPLLRALRVRFPEAWIGVLCNSYNAPVLAGNPDIDETFVYTKAKHRAAGESLATILFGRLRMMWRLRRMGIDDVIIATTAPQPRLVRQARWLQPQRIIGYGALPGLDVALPVAAGAGGDHEVEDVFRIARLYGITETPPPCRVAAPDGAAPRGPFTVGIHISARKPSQRWPAERFARLMQALGPTVPRFVLLWSPGDEDNPLHPGDDRKAAKVRQLCADLAPEARPTRVLGDLIAALAECDAVICADGGAMHLAAGLGKPIVCLFGNSGAARWRPWGVPYRLLQAPSLDVSDIDVDAVAAAFNALRDDIPARAA